MQQLLFALVVYTCPVHETCKDAIYETYESKEECETVIYEMRIFNGNCYEVESVIHKE
ncbi:DUF1482 family protein [Izhakiella australiensis]|uniref:DUF1482 family protein n=1 Tax=Izhakiella australiensis TaxID=1926881 RepID=UPI0011157731